MVILNPVKLTVKINIPVLNQRELQEFETQSQMHGPGDKGQQDSAGLQEAKRMLPRSSAACPIYPTLHTLGLEINTPLCWKEFFY